MLHRIYQGARFALAFVMAVGAVNMLAYYVHPEWFPPLHPFMQTMVDTGYLLVPKLLELVGAALLLTRYRVLGLVLLWPVIVNIALFHAFIDGRQGVNGVLLIALAALSSWPERSAFLALLAPRASTTTSAGAVKASGRPAPRSARPETGLTRNAQGSA